MESGMKCPECGEVNPADIHTCSPQLKEWNRKNGEHTLTLTDGRVLKSKDGISWTHDGTIKGGLE